jgi:hypothetical protein
MNLSSTLSLRELRGAVVQEHIAAEKAHDVPRILASFHHPRYEFRPFGSVIDGGQAVGELFKGLFAAFPDFDIERPQWSHTEETVRVECVVSGTRRRFFSGAPPSGWPIKLPLVAILEFNGELLIGEKIFFDLATLTRQLLA